MSPSARSTRLVGSPWECIDDDPIDRGLMRIAAFVGSTVLATVVILGAIVLLVVAEPAQVGWLIWLPTVAVMVLVYGPLAVGAATSYWDTRASVEAWHYFRWLFVVVYALQLLGVAAVVVFAVLTAAPVWLPVAFIAAAVVLNLLALLLGRALRRREESRRPVEPAWQPITRDSVVRRILVVVGVFVLVLVVGSAAFSLLFADTGAGHGEIGPGLMFAGEFALMAAALTCIVVSLRFNRIREHVSRDVGLVRKVAKVVLRGKPIPLRSEEESAAAKYAVVISVSLPFTLAYLALLYSALGMQQVGQLLTRPDDVFPKVLLVALVVVLVVILPLYIGRIRHARSYARNHAGQLPPAGPSAR